MILCSILTMFALSTGPSVSSEHGDFLAPFEDMIVPFQYPDQYIVLLHKNHTLEQHFQAIGRNLSSSTLFFRSYPYGYSAVMDNKTRDEQVRSDPGVEYIARDGPGPLVELEPVDVVLLDEPWLWEPSKPKIEYETIRQYDGTTELWVITD